MVSEATMGNTSMRGHHSITRDEMCVLERRMDGTLQKAFYPIRYDPRTREALLVLAENMRTWEDELTAEFLAAVEPLVAGAPYEKDVELIAGHFNDVALLTYQLTGVPMDYALLQQQTAHNRWQFPGGVHLLAKHAALIRGSPYPARQWRNAGHTLRIPSTRSSNGCIVRRPD